MNSGFYANKEIQGRSDFPVASRNPLNSNSTEATGKSLPLCQFYNPLKDANRSRANLPHWEQGEAMCFATFRLDDALPQEKREALARERNAWLNVYPKPWDEKTEALYYEIFGNKIEEWLDAGYGSCILRKIENRKIVEDALKHFDGKRYNLGAFVVMPNHVHVLFSPLGENTIPEILRTWKGFTAREINKHAGTQGSIWQKESWDTLIRSEKHLLRVIGYIFDNNAQLAQLRSDFPVASQTQLRSDFPVASQTQRRSDIPVASRNPLNSNSTEATGKSLQL